MADANLDRHIVERLRLDSHSVHYMAEMPPGIPDHVVLDLAGERNALILTYDRDFGELVFR